MSKVEAVECIRCASLIGGGPGGMAKHKQWCDEQFAMIAASQTITALDVARQEIRSLSERLSWFEILMTKFEPGSAPKVGDALLGYSWVRKDRASVTQSKTDWKWFGHAGHLIVGSQCQFHLCTLVGDILVSTVGEYWPEEGVREIIAQTRGVVLEGRGDDRAHDYMKKIGFEEIGFGRKYETMAFHTTGQVCKCGCGVPSIIPMEIESDAYNDAVAATEGHMRICEVVDKS